MSAFEPGDRCKTPDGTLAVFIKMVNEETAIIRVGVDSRLVDPMILRPVA